MDLRFRTVFTVPWCKYAVCCGPRTLKLLWSWQTHEKSRCPKYTSKAPSESADYRRSRLPLLRQQSSFLRAVKQQIPARLAVQGSPAGSWVGAGSKPRSLLRSRTAGPRCTAPADEPEIFLLPSVLWWGFFSLSVDCGTGLFFLTDLIKLLKPAKLRTNCRVCVCRLLSDVGSRYTFKALLSPHLPIFRKKTVRLRLASLYL